MSSSMKNGYEAVDRRIPHRLRVLYVEEGLSNPARNLLPLLSREVEYNLVTAETDWEFAKRYSMPIVTFPPPTFPVQRAWASTKFVGQILRETEVDLIHSHSGTDFLLPRSVPTITHVHGSWQVDWRRSWRSAGFTKRLRHLAGYMHYVVPEVISIRRATHVVAVSETVRRELIDLYDVSPERITVVSNAVPEHAYAVGSAKVSEDSPRIVYIGRLHSSKGIVEFTEAFGRVPDLSVEFVVVGSGPEGERMKRLAARDSRVSLTGPIWHEDVLQKLLTTNIFVFPSYYEGFSIAVLEAMATGHAVVARDIPAMREVLGQDVGFLCDDAARMVEAVAELSANPSLRFELQMRARKRAREFSWERSAHTLLQVYKKVIGGS